MRKPSVACTAGQRASSGSHREAQCNKTYNQKGIAIQSSITFVGFIVRFFFLMPIIRAIFCCETFPFLACFFFLIPSPTTECLKHSKKEWSRHHQSGTVCQSFAFTSCHVLPCHRLRECTSCSRSAALRLSERIKKREKKRSKEEHVQRAFILRQLLSWHFLYSMAASVSAAQSCWFLRQYRTIERFYF